MRSEPSRTQIPPHRVGLCSSGPPGGQRLLPERLVQSSQSSARNPPELWVGLGGGGHGNEGGRASLHSSWPSVSICRMSACMPSSCKMRGLNSFWDFGGEPILVTKAKMVRSEWYFQKEFCPTRLWGAFTTEATQPRPQVSGYPANASSSREQGEEVPGFTSQSSWGKCCPLSSLSRTRTLAPSRAFRKSILTAFMGAQNPFLPAHSVPPL